MYHGPRDQVVPFFDSLGFQIPERKGVADFIQEICSEKDQEVCLGFRLRVLSTLKGLFWQHCVVSSHCCWQTRAAVCLLSLQCQARGCFWPGL